MPTPNFNLRNIAPDVMHLLKKEAVKQKISVNSWILQTIEQKLGIAKTKKRAVFHDLDYLAGTWSAEDSKTFNESIKPFENIDEELWR